MLVRDYLRTPSDATDNSSGKGKQSTVTRMHVVDLAPLLPGADTLDDLLESTSGAWATIHDEMTPSESLWVFAPNERREGTFWPVAMAVADRARAESGLVLKNVVTRHREPEPGGDLRDAYEEILFLVTDKRSYRFDKDAVRVDHVYEGREWGGERESGTSAYHDTEVQRYNPNGRDPGNVWLEELRDGTPDETVDETRPLSRAEALRRCVRAGAGEDEPIHLWHGGEEFRAVVEREGRDANVRAFDAIEA